MWSVFNSSRIAQGSILADTNSYIKITGKIKARKPKHLISIGDFNKQLSRFGIRVLIWMTESNTKPNEKVVIIYKKKRSKRERAKEEKRVLLQGEFVVSFLDFGSIGTLRNPANEKRERYNEKSSLG